MPKHESTQQASKVVPTIFALTAFTVAIAGGLLAGNEPGTVLMRAIGAMVACQLVGVIAGAIVQKALDDHSAQASVRMEGELNVDGSGQPAQEERNRAAA